MRFYEIKPGFSVNVGLIKYIEDIGNDRYKITMVDDNVYCVHQHGTYVIVDFKTGRNVKHTKDDINTCLQVVLYAYLMEQQGLKVSRGEFRYLRSGETITCVYDDAMKHSLDTILTSFKNGLENFSFEGIVGDEDESSEEV